MLTYTRKAEKSGNITLIIEEIEGAEYSFDGENWSDNNEKSGVKAGERVTGYKRYKETDNSNTSGAVSDTETMQKFTVKTPVICPDSGSYTGSVSVTITYGSADAAVHPPAVPYAIQAHLP